MNFTQSFEEFSSSLTYMDIMLYAGAGIILWVLFKDKLSPIQKFIVNTVNNFKKNNSPLVVSPSIKDDTTNNEDKDLFFDLVASWKQTRDLAVKTGCVEAIKVADQMFPYLSPQGCPDKTKGNNTNENNSKFTK